MRRTCPPALLDVIPSKSARDGLPGIYDVKLTVAGVTATKLVVIGAEIEMPRVVQPERVGEFFLCMVLAYRRRDR